MSISSIKDNVFLLKRNTTIIENKTHVFSLRRNKNLKYTSDKFFAVNRLLNIDAEISVDTERIFHWRYENPGYKEKLIVPAIDYQLDSTKSKTGYGFWNRYWRKAFDIRPTRELWVRFDAYLSPNSSLRVINEIDRSNWSERDGFYINVNSTGGRSVVSGNEATFPAINAGFHSFLAHFKSGITDGIIQL